MRLFFAENQKSKKMKKVFYFLLVSVLLVFSCKVSTKKGAEKMDDATDNVIAQINALDHSEVSDAIKGFADLGSLPIDEKKLSTSEKLKLITNVGVTIKRTLINRFPRIFNHKSDHFTISEYAGTYTWNFSTQDWDYSSSPSDKIVIIFPSNNSSTNDCKFEWSEYNENSDYIPTRIYAVLYMKDKLIGKIDYTGLFDSDYYPTLIDLELKISSIKLKLDYKMKDLVVDVSAVLKNNSRTIDDFSGKFYLDKNSKCSEFYKGSGVFKTYKLDNGVNLGVLLKIKFKYDYTDEKCDWDDDDYNEHTKIKIYTSSDRLIGHVEYNYSSDCGAEIVFNDGTVQDVCQYFDRIDDAIEDAFDD